MPDPAQYPQCGGSFMTPCPNCGGEMVHLLTGDQCCTCGHTLPNVHSIGTPAGYCQDCGATGYAHRALVCSAKQERAVKDIGELIRAYDERARYAHQLAANMETVAHRGDVERFRFDTCTAGGCVGAKAVLERMRARYRAMLSTRAEPCATCRGKQFTCSCGDPDHVPCQSSHKAVPCPECSRTTPSGPDPRDRAAWLGAITGRWHATFSWGHNHIHGKGHGHGHAEEGAHGRSHAHGHIHLYGDAHPSPIPDHPLSPDRRGY